MQSVTERTDKKIILQISYAPCRALLFSKENPHTYSRLYVLATRHWRKGLEIKLRDE